MNQLVKECSGCGLCANVCSEKAIKMSENEEGFLYAFVDTQKCNKCGACWEICNKYKKQCYEKNMPLRVEACQAKNEKWLIESTAGGFFPTIAEWIIEEKGVVFGTAYDENMTPIVCKAESIDEIRKFNGSKYVQSDLTKALPEIGKELRKRKLVLFSGTPCQVAAVKTLYREYVGKTLITMDVVCYGVPSPGLFGAFLKSIERDKQARIIDYRFRDKHRHGWSHTTVITMVNDKGDIIKFEEKDYSKVPYYKMFGARNCFRKECYCCQYNTIKRTSDFTTGNFWGIENMTDEFETRNGVSMVLINTNFANIIYEKVKNRFQTLDMSIEHAIQANDALVHTCKYPYERDAIYRYFRKHGFEAMFNKFYSDTVINRVKKKVRNILSKFCI